MRFYGLALFASAAVLGACGGGENKGTTTDSAAQATSTAPAATTPAPGGAAAAAPITGTTHEVKMVGDDKGYRFEPANITVKTGDGIKFVMVSGGPHNVAFDPATVPEPAKKQLTANMPQQISELSSPMMMNPNESYTISFAGVPAGQYPYHCTPHLAMNMKGVITVQ
jgi:plastocyanin